MGDAPSQGSALSTALGRIYLVSLTFASWNQIVECFQELEALRQLA
jgi:hypothetical protein